MSECNCHCCCAYLNPPWWVTMGYAPPIPSHAQVSSAPQRPSTSAARPANQGTIVDPPLGRSQTASATPAVRRPTVSREVATGNLVSAIGDAMRLL
jgi:hypothetical protein